MSALSFARPFPIRLAAVVGAASAATCRSLREALRQLNASDDRTAKLIDPFRFGAAEQQQQHQHRQQKSLGRGF